jgi:hypothetical protein
VAALLPHPPEPPRRGCDKCVQPARPSPLWALRAARRTAGAATLASLLAVTTVACSRGGGREAARPRLWRRGRQRWRGGAARERLRPGAARSDDAGGETARRLEDVLLLDVADDVRQLRRPRASPAGGAA